MNNPFIPPVLGLFQKRIDGDDALLALAKLRFEQAGVGAEFYTGSPEELQRLLVYQPVVAAPIIVHWPRGVNVFEPESRRWMAAWARRFSGDVFGYVLHDQRELMTAPSSYLRAIGELSDALRKAGTTAWIFVEYAVGVAPDAFVEFSHQVREMPRVSVCIDVGHLGIHAARAAFAKSTSHVDLCVLKPSHPDFLTYAAEMERAVASALPEVCAVISGVEASEKVVHFHLHDGHPASTASPFGVCDHLPFGAEIPLPFEYHGRRELRPMFGREGLRVIARDAMRAYGEKGISFTLEIHPLRERRPLADAEGLFTEWREKENAEIMNQWLAVLTENALRLKEALSENCPSPSGRLSPDLSIGAEID